MEMTIYEVVFVAKGGRIGRARMAVELGVQIDPQDILKSGPIPIVQADIYQVDEHGKRLTPCLS
jgi:hypothetical protein